MHVQKCGSTMVLLCAILLQHLQQTTSQTYVKDVYCLCALQNTLDSDGTLLFFQTNKTQINCAFNHLIAFLYIFRAVESRNVLLKVAERNL